MTLLELIGGVIALIIVLILCRILLGVEDP